MLLYNNVDSLNDLDKHFIKARLRNTEFSSCKNTGKIIEKNLPKNELKFLLCLQDEIQLQVKVSKSL